MKKTIITALFTILVLQPSFAEVASESTIDANERPSVQATDNSYGDIIIAGGNPFGLRFAIAGAICDFATAEKSACLVRSAKNSGDGISLLQSGKVNFALVQSDWLAHARDGTSRFSEVGKDNTLINVSTLLAESVVLVASKDSGIEKVSDLKNSNFDIGSEGTYRNVVSNVILDSVGLDLGDVKVSNRKQDDSVEALCKGKIDATLFVLSNPNPILDTMMAQCNVKIISLNEKEISFVGKNLKGFYPSNIPAETYWGQDVSIRTVGLYTVLISSKDSDKNMMKKMRNAVIDNIDKLSVMHITLNGLNIDALKTLK